MDMKIEHIPPTDIAYIRHTGPYGSGNKQTMEQLKQWAAATHRLDDESVIFGIAWDNPAETSPKSCRYDACLVVAGLDGIRGHEVSCGTIGDGKYAVFTVCHTAQAVAQAWQDIFPELQRLGLTMDTARPVLERYATKMVQRRQCEVCVPVQ